MRLPRLTSIRQRLLLISAAITLLTLVVVGTAFVVNDVHMLRSQMVRDLDVLSVAVGDNCLSSLVFDAPETAEKNLASLRREPQIRYAVLYDAEGRPFARYRRDAGENPRDPIDKGQGVIVDSPLLGLGTVDVVRELVLDGRPVGRIFIHARMDLLAVQLRRYAGMVGLLFLAALTASLLLALRLNRRVSEPILHLAAKTREISEGGSYALRVSPPSSDDEVETLFRGFNAMLEQIERRERDLTHIRENLAQLVEERTRALDGIVREQRLILEALPLGVLHLVGRRILRVNPRAAELFGWGAGEMPGLSTEHFYPDREAYEEVGRVGYVQMAGGGIYRDDRILQRKDGSRFWGRLIGQYIDPSDVELGSIWILDDIDRDKALEARLRQAREAAEAANRAKDTFLANMSHDLRTPLNAVLGFAQLLEGDTRLDEDQHRQAEGIRRGGERLLGLIDEVLDLAKIEADRIEPMPVEWDSAELLQELQGMFRARAEGKGIELCIGQVGELPPRLRCDVKRLHQTLANLLDNAVKYTDRGRVSLGAGFAEGHLTIEVADTGIGIPVGEIKHVFEPFHRVDRPGRQSQGTGLGLAIAKGLVERMGGILSVESSPGQGSVFRIRIPAQPASIPEPDAEVEPPHAGVVGYRRTRGRGPLRILVTDDEPVNRAILRGLLELIGFTVQEAEDGSDCIRKAKDRLPDLICMDLRMPSMDGLETTRALREIPALRQIPIVAITAAAFGEDRAEALRAGCDAHLTKPVLRDALIRTLGALLPLGWTREAAQDTEEGVSEDVRTLPPDRRQRLVELVRTGSVTAISALAQELVREDCCPDLARRIARLADAFDIAGLRRLAEGFATAEGPDGAEDIRPSGPYNLRD